MSGWVADRNPACGREWSALSGCERLGGWSHSCSRRRGHDWRCRCACGTVALHRSGVGMGERELTTLRDEVERIAQPLFLISLAVLSGVPIAVLSVPPVDRT